MGKRGDPTTVREDDSPEGLGQPAADRIVHERYLMAPDSAQSVPRMMRERIQVAAVEEGGIEGSRQLVLPMPKRTIPIDLWHLLSLHSEARGVTIFSIALDWSTRNPDRFVCSPLPRSGASGRGADILSCSSDH